MKIAVTGYRGRLGSELVKVGCIPLQSDVLDADEIRDEIHRINPEFIIHAAAITDVDSCEIQATYKRATAIAVRGTDNLMCSPAKIIYISSDYVFNGRHGPYDERGKPYPIQGYGFTKWAGEVTVSHAGRPGDCIVRTTGLYGGCSGRHDFSRLVVDYLRNFRTLEVTDSLVANQTYIPHLVNGLLALTELSSYPNVIHIASRDMISRYRFAMDVAKTFGLDTEFLQKARNGHVPGWIAERPQKAGLHTRLARYLDIPIYSIRDGLDELRRVCEYQS